MNETTGNRYGHPKGACGTPGCTGCNPNRDTSREAALGVDLSAPTVGMNMPTGTEVAYRDIVEGDYIVIDGRLHEVVSITEDIEDFEGDITELYIGDDAVEFTTLCGDDEYYIAFSGTDTVGQVDDSARYLDDSTAKRMFPDRVFEEDFNTRYGVVPGPGGSDAHETPPAGTPEDRVWSQIEGFTADGRYDYTVVPGHVSDAINYVVTEKPWTEADYDTTFDWN